MTPPPPPRPGIPPTNISTAHAPRADHHPSPPAPTPQDDPDREDLRLIAAVRVNHPGAWSQLLARYQDRLFGVCVRMIGGGASGPAALTKARQTAADLCQDAMVKVIQGLPSFDGSAKFSTWAIRVTMNVCLSHLRAAKLRQTQSLDDVGGGHVVTSAPQSGGSGGKSRGGDANASVIRHQPNSGPSSLEPVGVSGVLQDEQRRAVLAALDRLDPEQRAIVVLRDVRGLDYDQIAQVLGIAVGTVKSRLFRARAALREQIEADRPAGDSHEDL